MDLKEASNRTETLISRHPWELARLEVCISLLKAELNAANRDRRVLLDMGCGDTWFLEQLLERYPNIRYIGVDVNFDAEFIARSNAKHGSRISLGTSLGEVSSGLNEQPIAIVLLLDVIEHISDDISFMTELFQSSHFDTGTRILITVPAFQTLFSKHDVFLEHYRRYNNALLKKNTAASGLKIIRLGYFFSSLLILRSIGVAKERLIKDTKETTGLVEWNRGKTVSGIFRRLLIADYAFSLMMGRIKLTLPGLSNYAICKKSV
jgi:trans-aconitate methyltransferase